METLTSAPVPQTEKEGQPPGEIPSFFAREVRVPPENLPPITFLYFGHKIENVDKILEAVKDADLILSEQVGLTPKEREVEEALQNLILSPGFGREPKEKEYIETLLTSNSHYSVLLVRLAGSGKRIKFIDVPSSHPALETWRKAKEAESQIQGEMERNIREAYRNYHLKVDLTAQSYQEREAYVFQQLSALMAELKEERHPDLRKVAVLQGPVHTSVHHRFKKTFPEAQVRYQTEEPLFMYSPFNTLVRRRLFFPDQEIPETEYQKTFLTEEIFYPSFFARFMNTEPNPGKAYEKALRLAQNLSGQLSPQEAQEVFEDCEEKLKERQVRGGGRFRGEIGDDKILIAVEISNLVTLEWAKKKGVKLPQESPQP